MEIETPKSKCLMCKKEYTAQGMQKHINNCLPKHNKQEAKGKPKQSWYLVVKTPFSSPFFLHLLLSGTATLQDLDSYLRRTWLECCGHLSSFSKERFGDDIDFKQKIKDVFSPGTTLCHQYDFGSTTELTVTCVDICEGSSGSKIKLLSRNAIPIVTCSKCNKKPAVEICTECVYDGTGFLCKDCAKSHECGEEMFLPVVNSPRAGVCGYSG